MRDGGIGPQGSFTVETALVMSAVLLILAGLLCSFMLLFQKALLVRTATELARMAALAGGGSGLSGSREVTVMTAKDRSELVKYQDGLARNKTAFDEELDLYDKLRLAACDHLLARSLLDGPVSLKIAVDGGAVDGGVWGQRITVVVTQEKEVPFLALLLQNKTINLEGEGSAVVRNPVRLIHGVDHLLEYTRKLGL